MASFFIASPQCMGGMVMGCRGIKGQVLEVDLWVVRLNGGCKSSFNTVTVKSYRYGTDYRSIPHDNS